jgi:putative tryptophan/tyrosine transport system substrate-binding protein
VRLGLVASINRPGGNITGVAQLVVASEGKRLELLRELTPDAKLVAFLTNPKRPNSPQQTQAMQEAARALTLGLVVLEAHDDDDLPQALAAARSQAGALVVGADPYFFARYERIVVLVERHALPAVYFFREFVLAGGLASYGSNLAHAYHQVGVYTGKVLNGAAPADLPMVQQSDKLELVINLKTAKALGLHIPPTLLARADEVIE